MRFFRDESERRREFPVVENGIFLGHAGVTILPRRVADSMKAHAETSCHQHQEFGEVLQDVARTRSLCAQLIGAHADEIALLVRLRSG